MNRDITGQERAFETRQSTPSPCIFRKYCETKELGTTTDCESPCKWLTDKHLCLMTDCRAAFECFYLHCSNLGHELPAAENTAQVSQNWEVTYVAVPPGGLTRLCH